MTSVPIALLLEETDHVGRLLPVSWGESLRHELKRTRAHGLEYIVEGKLAPGLCLLVGRPWAGKTVLCRQLALAVANGTLFLGRKVKQGKVLYLALENDAESLVRKLTELNGGPLPENLGLLSKEHAASIDDLERTMEAHREDLALVIIDLLEDVMPEPNGTFAPRVELRAGKRLSQIAGRAAIVALVHEKEGRARDSGAKTIYTTGFPAAADSQWNLTSYKTAGRGHSNGTGRLEFEGRDIDLTPIQLKHLDGGTYASRWEVAPPSGASDPDAPAAKSSSPRTREPSVERQQIQNHLLREGRDLTPAEVARFLAPQASREEHERLRKSTGKLMRAMVQATPPQLQRGSRSDTYRWVRRKNGSATATP